MSFKLDKNVALRNITLAITSKADKDLVLGYFLSDLSKYPNFDPVMRGRYNGYVILGKDHLLVDKKDFLGDYDVHGGITFANKLKDFNIDPYPELWAYADNWVVGFDTAHAGDNYEKWSLQRTISETCKFYMLMCNVDEYRDVYLTDFSDNIVFKFKDDTAVYLYDSMREKLFKISNNEFKEQNYIKSSKVKIKVLRKF